MDAKVFVLAIIFMAIFIPSLFKLARDYMRHSAAQQATNEEAVRSTAEMLERLAQLEERVRVLERIVTDGRYELERRFREIES